MFLCCCYYHESGLTSDSAVLASVEKYSFFQDEKRWTLLDESCSMKAARWGHSVVSMPCRNAIFAIGGRNSSWKELSSVEVAQQDPTGNLEWKRLPYGMRQKRFGAAAVLIGKHSFMVMGGFDGTEWTRSSVMYEVDNDDIRDGMWTDLPDMPMAVTFAKAVTTTLHEKEFVFVAGSTEDGNSILQVYDVKESIWALVSLEEDEDSGSLAVEGEFLISVGGNTNKIRYINLQEESQKGILGVLCGSLGGEGSFVEVSAVAVAQEASHQQVNDDHPEAPQDSTPTFTNKAKAPQPEPEPGPQPLLQTRRVQNMDCVIDGEQARYTGELNSSGQRHGRGVLVWADENGSFFPKELSKNTFYEGEFNEDFRKGKGVFYVQEEGRLYEGIFDRGVLFGEGKLTDVHRGIVYEGGFRKGMSFGEGRCHYQATGRTFVGTWKRGKPISGQLVEVDGRVVQSGNGPWSLDLAVDISRAGPNAAANLVRGSRSSSGVKVPATARNVPVPGQPHDNPSIGSSYVEKKECVVEGERVQYTGQVSAVGQRHGRGLMLWADEEGKFYPKESFKNTFYEGQFFEDSRTGHGLMYVKEEDRVYQGTFDRGVLSGEGTLEDRRRGLKYQGNFRRGTPDGEGKCIYETSNRVFSGSWRKGQPFAGMLYNGHGQLLQQGSTGWGLELSID